MDAEFIKKTELRRPKVDNHFELNENYQIGRGSYGVVYKVKRRSDNKNTRFYALKLVELAPYSSSTCREISVSFTLNS